MLVLSFLSLISIHALSRLVAIHFWHSVGNCIYLISFSHTYWDLKLVFGLLCVRANYAPVCSILDIKFLCISLS